MLTIYKIIAIFLMLTTIFYLIFRINKKIEMNILLITIFLISMISGLIVNPMRIGTDIIYEQEIVKQIENIVQKDKEGKWIVEGLTYPYINIPIMVGAPTINCTNVYPNMERWKNIDDNGKYEEIYNRYAHIHINLIEEETYFELNTPDSYTVFLNYNDLKAIEAKYILTCNKLEDKEISEMSFKILYEDNKFKLYEIVYNF